MRAKPFNPARMSRALVATLFISLVQVVVAPVLAPQLTTSTAAAADANDFPTGLGTVYQFLAESYTSGSTTWPEARGGTGATISSSALKVTNSANTLGASKSVVAVQGSYQTSITFPSTVAYGNATNPNDYTFFHVARYAPQQPGLTNADYCDTSANHTVNNAAKKSRIFSSSANNWLSGFWGCNVGVSHHYGWLTQYSNSISELSGNNGNNWLLSADCGYVATSSSGCNGRYRALGTDRTTTPSTSVVGHSVVVNGGQFPAEVSDFQIAEVISFPTILSVANIIKVETYLARKYGINLSSSSATKLSVLRASSGTNLNEPFATQPQIVIQDANGQTVTTDNTTLITATVTGLNGKIIGTATADAVQGVATFENLGIDGSPGNSYTITYTSNTGLATTSESRTFTRGGGSETDTALSFNGSSQYAEKLDATGSPYDITGNITLQAWVFPTSDCTSDQGVVAKVNSYMLYCGSSGFWKYVFDADGLNWSGSTSGVKVRKNEWHHIAYVKSGTTLQIYMDGNVVQTITGVSATIGANNDAFQIGRFATGSYFQGEIDEVRVYKSARTQSEIQSDMHAYGTISDTNLAAYYDFNEGSGTTLYNRTQYASSLSDMSLSGSPTWLDVKSVDTTTLSAYTIVKFDRSYLTSFGGWKSPNAITQIRALVIGGGGGGGSDEGGGGGGGGFIDTTTLTIGANSFVTINVGAGGAGAEGNDVFDAMNGQDSVLDSLVAVGGGAGGSSVNTNIAVRNGRPGGSGGGGAGESLSNRAGGAGTVGQGFSGGNGINAGSGGGGGGATEAGNADGNGTGGDGKASDITGSTITYGGGGGGGNGNTGSTSYVGGDGGGGRGGSTSVTALSGTAGLGGGGGGAGSLSTATLSVAYSGADGGSGVIVIRWITAAKPIFTQPQSDTTTAGLTDTITVSANPISPLTRSYQWQVSSDTGTSWSNATNGSGFTSNTYTTPVLETSTSGIRYQYRVVVTDSDSTGLFIIDTSVAVFITVNARITFSGSYTVQKYGSTHQDTFTALSGTGDKTFSYSPNNRSGITWYSPSANTAVLTIGTTLFVGTYLETITATDSKGAQSSLAISIVISKADTITVTAIARSETYTGSTLTFTPAFTVSGLINSDTVTASAMSWNYNGIENSGTLYAIQSTRPTNAGSYMITPVAPASLADSYTAVTVVAASLTVNRATRTISITPPGSPIKYGETKTVTASPSAGAGDGSISFASSTTDSCTVSSSTVTAIKSSGTCAFTATITRGNNYETATSTSGTSTLTKADTLTVTVNAISPVTYTGAQVGITPSVTVTGLKLSNAVGATPATIKYASSGGDSASCASGGACAVGDTGPGGGTVFYDAGAQQSWGRYLEIAKSGWGGAGETTAKWCSTALNATALNVTTDGVGQGLANSTTIANSCGEGAAFLARAYNGGGKSNWYLPTSAEFALMYTNRSVIDLSTSTLIWLSQEANDANMNWVARVGALSSSGIGGNNKVDTLTLRPIRAFAAGDTAQNFILTKPTDADTYTVRASELTLSNGSLSDYQGVNYVDATLRINRAQQYQLMLAEYGAMLGTPYRIIVFGGSGTGATSVTYSSGTASGCSLSGETLTATSSGTCRVTATKARDKNYETATVTIDVYFLQFVEELPVLVVPSAPGPGIALTGETAIIRDPNAAPSITSVGSSGDMTYPIAINGAGFSAATAANTTIKFWRGQVVNSPDFIIKSDTLIWSKQPLSATKGRLLVTNGNGSAVSPEEFTPITFNI